MTPREIREVARLCSAALRLLLEAAPRDADTMALQGRLHCSAMAIEGMRYATGAVASAVRARGSMIAFAYHALALSGKVPDLVVREDLGLCERLIGRMVTGPESEKHPFE